jgi:hypothetical protein
MRIKILKDGENRDFFYKKGEIYEATYSKTYKKCVRILNTECLVTYQEAEKFGIECEILLDNKIYELW